MNTGIIIQARQSSTRFPGKIMLPLPYGSGVSVLGRVIERCLKACPTVIVATTTEPEDEATAMEAQKYGAAVYRGSLNDVLARYAGAASEYGLDNIVRITSDCPCVDPGIISGVINLLLDSRSDYASNVENRTFPHGTDTEAFTAEALNKSDREEKRPEIREHVTLCIRRSPDYKKADYLAEEPVPQIRATLDTPEDYTALLAVFDLLGENFTWRDLAGLYRRKPWLARINGNVYQKKAFSGKAEEMAEAARLLALHNMREAEKLVKAWKSHENTASRK